MTSARLTELSSIFATGKRSEVIAAGKELIEQVQKLQRRRDKAIGPTLREVCEYAQQKGRSLDEASDFWNRYEATGWKYGSSKIVKWQNAFNRWKGNRFLPVNGNGSKPQGIGAKYGVGS